MIKHKKLPADIFNNIEAAKIVLRHDKNVIFAYLFGGLLREKTPLSDIDIAVYLREGDDLPEYRLDLYSSLTESLKTEELDLVILNTATLSLAGRILMNRRVLIDKEPFVRHSYESLTLRKFFDFRIKEEALLKRRFGVG